MANFAPQGEQKCHQGVIILKDGACNPALIPLHIAQAMTPRQIGAKIMAKQNEAAQEMGDTPAGIVLAGVKSHYQPEGTSEKYEVDWGNVPAASVKYALETSLAKLIGNSASNIATTTTSRLAREALGDYTRVKGTDHSARYLAEKEWLEANKDAVKATIASEQAEARKSAFAAVLDGTIADRARASSADPLTVMIDAVLTNAVRNHAAKTGQAIPQGAEMTKAKKAVLEQHGAEKVRAKAQAMLEASSF